jgi:hypothetical protein
VTVHLPEKWKVGGSTPPLTTHRTPAKILPLLAAARLSSCLPRCPAGLRLSVRRRPPLFVAAVGHRYSVGYSSAGHGSSGAALGATVTTPSAHPRGNRATATSTRRPGTSPRAVTSNRSWRSTSMSIRTPNTMCSWRAVFSVSPVTASAHTSIWEPSTSVTI